MHFTNMVTNFANELMRLDNIVSTDPRLLSISSHLDRSTSDLQDYALPLTDAVKLRDNYIFVDELMAPEKWAIFINWNTYARPDTAATRYWLCGTIDSGLTAADFVSSAYQYVLGREPDLAGGLHYRARIESMEYAQHDVLNALLSSDEALNKRIHILVVPQPSRWLIDLVPTLSVEI